VSTTKIAPSHNPFAPELILDAKATLGEGALWDVTTKRLFWVDILQSQLHRFDPATKTDEVFDVGEHVGTVVTAAKGGVMLAVKRGFAHFNLETKVLKLVAEPEKGKEGLRFNDGKCDPKGRFWAGSYAYNDAPGAGTLFRLDPDGSVRIMEKNVTCSNGLAWDLWRRLFYFIDSGTKSIVAYDYNHADGAIDHKRVVVQCTPEDGVPDGMAIDVDGKLWVAHWGGSQIVRWDPDTGRALKRIKVPVSQPTALAFGGNRLDKLYITSARLGLTDAQLLKEPQAGGLFVVTPGICGVEQTPYAG